MSQFVPYIFIGLAILFVIFFVRGLIKAISNRNNLMKNGIQVKAKVLSIEKELINTGSTTSEPFQEVTVQIEDESMSDEVITIKNRFYSAPPKEGDIINIIVDPENINNAIISPTD